MLTRAPRLLIAFFVALLFIFYLRTPSDPPQPAAVATSYPGPDLKSRPEAKDNAPLPKEIKSPGELAPEHRDERPEKESVSDRLFDYLKGHNSHNQNAKSPVPHEEHVAIKPQASAVPSKEAAKDPACAALPDVSDVLVIVRTPAADIYNHLPSHFLTDLRCVDFLLYSTVHQNIGPYTIYDALANLSDTTRSKHKDFELYDRIQDAQNAVADLSMHKEDNEHNLDRWTILPHVLSTYKMQPNKKWYVFIESDTYLSVSNLMPWLKKMDHTRPVYAGAPVMIGDIELAHSGSGIVLSHAALEALSKKSTEQWDEWEHAISQSCCGDKILAEALKDCGIRLHRSFPLIQGESPFSLDWSERHWCRPAVSWHSMTPMSIDMLWQFETSWLKKHAEDANPPPMRFKDYFQMFLIPLIRQSQNRTDWDNLASSLIYTDQTNSQWAHYSFESCRAACDLRQSCVQFAHEPNKCRLGTVVRWGGAVTSDKRMISGWMAQRVEKFGNQVGSGVCDDDDLWILPGDEPEPEPEVPKEPVKDALQLEEEQLQAKAAQEERAKAEQKAKEEAAAKEAAKEKAMQEGIPKEDSDAEPGGSGSGTSKEESSDSAVSTKDDADKSALAESGLVFDKTPLKTENHYVAES